MVVATISRHSTASACTHPLDLAAISMHVYGDKFLNSWPSSRGLFGYPAGEGVAVALGVPITLPEYWHLVDERE